MTYRGVKRLLVPFYEAQFPTARIVTELPSDLQLRLPLIQVVGISDLPDPKAPQRFREVRWVLQTFAVGDVAAEDFCNDVAAVSTTVLPGSSLADADVPYVAQVAGPTWLPYPDTQVRQYMASFTARLLVTNPR